MTNDGPTNNDHPLVHRFQDILLEGRPVTHTTDNRDRFPSVRTGQEGEDTPLTDLKQLERNLKDGMEYVMYFNKPLVDSLGRSGVDIDGSGMLHAIKDVIDDYLGLEMMRLENME